MTKFLVLAAVLLASCGGVSAVAPDGDASTGAGGGSAGMGATSGSSGGAGDGASDGAQAGATAGGGAGTTGAAGGGGAGAGGGSASDAGAAGAGGTTGAAGAVADAGTDTGGEQRPWCLDPLPADVPSSCSDVNVSGATSSPKTTDCAGLPKKTVRLFGALDCKRCSTTSGHSLDTCLATWSSSHGSEKYDGGSISCAYPAVYCVLSCSECQ